MMVAIDMVEAGTRLRSADPEQVAALANSIAEVGLLSPITVYARPVVRAGIEVPGWGIVAGLHRLEACRSLGMVEIEAAVTDMPELKRQIAECDENLCGTKLTQAQRALFTRRRKQAYEALHPETRNGTNQHGRVGKDCQPNFAADTAARTGQAERTVRLDAMRGTRIAEDVLASVAGTKLDTGRILDALAAVPHQEQQAALTRIQEVSQVKPVPLPEERQQAAMATSAEVARKSMETRVRTEYGILAELSHIAVLAMVRLDQANGGQSTADRDLAAVKAMLQEIENAGHQAYLAKHGTEEDYEAIGSKVEKRYRTPSGKWRS